MGAFLGLVQNGQLFQFSAFFGQSHIHAPIVALRKRSDLYSTAYTLGVANLHNGGSLFMADRLAIQIHRTGQYLLFENGHHGRHGVSGLAKDFILVGIMACNGPDTEGYRDDPIENRFFALCVVVGHSNEVTGSCVDGSVAEMEGFEVTGEIVARAGGKLMRGIPDPGHKGVCWRWLIG
jgi:hypothetical protein